MNKYIVASVIEGKAANFYTAITQSTNELSDNMQDALLIDQKPLARSAASAYQSQFPDLEITVLPVSVTISLR
jgi:hypothetical protein